MTMRTQKTKRILLRRKLKKRRQPKKFTLFQRLNNLKTLWIMLSDFAVITSGHARKGNSADKAVWLYRHGITPRKYDFFSDSIFNYVYSLTP